MRYTGFAAVILLFFAAWARGEETPPRRAIPPKWSAEVLGTFFEDARQQLVGTRPVAVTKKTQAKAMLPEVDSSWAKLIDSDTLATEIKRIANGLSEAVSKPGKFHGAGYQQCRRDFSLLAVLFGVVEEYSEQVRWQSDAGQMRQHLLRAANHCEVASAQSYANAKQTHGLLLDLIRGQSPQDDAKLEPLDELADRSQLMQRMELTVEEVITVSLSNNKKFRRRGPEIARASQLFAVLAKVIQREDYENSDDTTFAAYAHQLGEASAALSQAVQEQNYETARTAAGRLTQSCSICHEDFRG